MGKEPVVLKTIKLECNFFSTRPDRHGYHVNNGGYRAFLAGWGNFEAINLLLNRVERERIPPGQPGTLRFSFTGDVAGHPETFYVGVRCRYEAFRPPAVRDTGIIPYQDRDFYTSDNTLKPDLILFGMLTGMGYREITDGELAFDY